MSGGLTSRRTSPGISARAKRISLRLHEVRLIGVVASSVALISGCGSAAAPSATGSPATTALTRASVTTAASATPALLKSRSARCRATSYLFGDYQGFAISIHSNQRRQKVTVTVLGETATAHTNGAGDAKLQFDIDPVARGKAFTVRVGAATCSAFLGRS
jgi:hypothetical protein